MFLAVLMDKLTASATGGIEIIQPDNTDSDYRNSYKFGFGTYNSKIARCKRL
jgi:hypothetical protein